MKVTNTPPIDIPYQLQACRRHTTFPCGVQAFKVQFAAMKTIRKRIYTILPRPVASSTSPPAASTITRARSNSMSSSAVRSLHTMSQVSPLSFFDSPPPPTPGSRPGTAGNLAFTRLAAEGKSELETQTDTPSNHSSYNAAQAHSHSGNYSHYSLAASSCQSELVTELAPPLLTPFFPYASLTPAFTSSPVNDVSSIPVAGRPQTHFHLDAGAYGIPKRSRATYAADHGAYSRRAYESSPFSHRDDFNLLSHAVQVGEDAYFIHQSAMGVADGVGGWSRLRRTARREDANLSPSALFARRLMHHCCEEVEAARAALITPPLPSRLPDASPPTADDLYTDLEDSLEELADGLDVLMILEKAYERTIQAHTQSHTASSINVTGSPEPPVPVDVTNLPTQSYGAAHAAGARDNKSEFALCPETHGSSSWSSVLSPSAKPGPSETSMQGSATVLLAVLEHPSVGPLKQENPSLLFSPKASKAEGPPSVAGRGAVIKVAHLGDCVGMLVRGDEIVWRTEEMWWNFNTPVQLGPSSPTKPREAQLFTVPVQVDDILILASDGLSDNLWDEDVLDEVVRFRHMFWKDGSWFGPSSLNKSGQTGFARNAMAAMLSEALCSRARLAAEKRTNDDKCSLNTSCEVPFARRAREQGKAFHGGKPDDISVLVAVISEGAA
ncbi:uncharacterized protein FIBRA_00461 [Fibroporia radiculosa]|uniref:Protein phosphatase n=1 Tax=Fibroporia radiculosa TaxID=599839 RepID=J4G096_9APHY|nr:uncharacterized protein FIBRA_00461 [Fibroporia radiculosa]CCL98463.1 predicted protein [Fibroporia radiculosa]